MNNEPLPPAGEVRDFLPSSRPIGFLLPAAATAIAPAIPAAANPMKLRRVTPACSGWTCSCKLFPVAVAPLGIRPSPREAVKMKK